MSSHLNSVLKEQVIITSSKFMKAGRTALQPPLGFVWFIFFLEASPNGSVEPTAGIEPAA